MTLSQWGHGRAGLILKVLVGVAVVTAAPRWGWSQPGNDWIGKRVITKLGARLRTEPALVDNEKRDADAVSDLRNAGRIFRVERVNPPWLWIQDGKNSTAGWVTADWLVARDEAVDYFTSVILANPSSVAAYLGRGRIRRIRTNRTSHSRTSTRPSGSTPRSRSPTTTAARSGSAKRRTTRRSPTIPKRFSSIPNSPRPTPIAAGHGTKRSNTTTPLRISTRPSDSTPGTPGTTTTWA